MCEGESVYLYALLSPCECFGGLLLFAPKRRAARPVARANTNAPIAAIRSPFVVNMPRYAFFFLFQIHCAEQNLFPFSCFFFQRKFCAREREDRVRFSRGQSGSLKLSLNISLSYFLFSYSFSCALFLLVLLILGFFKNVFFRVFWGLICFADIIVITAIRT